MAELKISLAAARVNAGMTQEEVAEQIKCSKNHIIDLEKGRSKIKPTELVFLSHLYNIPVDNIFLPS